ncbi:MAG: hypothetical protein IPK33_09035 [Gemmatimonadetes bacterium]|nr:hypothetical protein [Gemmatimonadota bacterium]
MIDVTDVALQQRKLQLGVGPRLASATPRSSTVMSLEGHVPAPTSKAHAVQKAAIIGIAPRGMLGGEPRWKCAAGARPSTMWSPFPRGRRRGFASH